MLGCSCCIVEPLKVSPGKQASTPCPLSVRQRGTKFLCCSPVWCGRLLEVWAVAVLLHTGEKTASFANSAHQVARVLAFLTLQSGLARVRFLVLLRVLIQMPKLLANWQGTWTASQKGRGQCANGKQFISLSSTHMGLGMACTRHSTENQMRLGHQTAWFYCF